MECASPGKLVQWQAIQGTALHAPSGALRLCSDILAGSTHTSRTIFPPTDSAIAIRGSPVLVQLPVPGWDRPGYILPPVGAHVGAPVGAPVAVPVGVPVGAPAGAPVVSRCAPVVALLVPVLVPRWCRR